MAEPKTNTKPYYIMIEEQGNLLGVVRVEASSTTEAEQKALRAYHGTEELTEISPSEARDMLDEGYLNYAIDEDGCEIDEDDVQNDIDDEDD